jgi:beta-lactamase regulating signal transducer with metallopeptidase domain
MATNQSLPRYSTTALASSEISSCCSSNTTSTAQADIQKSIITTVEKTPFWVWIVLIVAILLLLYILFKGREEVKK